MRDAMQYQETLSKKTEDDSFWGRRSRGNSFLCTAGIRRRVAVRLGPDAECSAAGRRDRRLQHEQHGAGLPRSLPKEVSENKSYDRDRARLSTRPEGAARGPGGQVV